MTGEWERLLCVHDSTQPADETLSKCGCDLDARPVLSKRLLLSFAPEPVVPRLSGNCEGATHPRANYKAELRQGHMNLCLVRDKDSCDAHHWSWAGTGVTMRLQSRIYWRVGLFRMQNFVPYETKIQVTRITGVGLELGLR